MNSTINNTGRNRRKRLGQTLVEFTFVGIPIIFILISIFEVSRGMWLYHTLAYAVKIGTRYASVHGINCVNSASNANNCLVNMGPVAAPGAGTLPSIAYVIRQAAVGLDPTKTTLTFTDASGTAYSCTLANGACSGSSWPTNDGTTDAVGQPIRIDMTTPFNSAIALLWPGAKVVKFASGTLGATSQEFVQF